MGNRFLKITIILYVLSGAILILGKKSWFPDFYNPDFMGVTAFIAAFIIMLPKIIFRSADEEKKIILSRLQGVITICLILNSLGGLGLFQLYKYGFEYDKLMHFTVPLILTIAFSFFINKYFYSISIKKALVITIILIMAGSTIWEFYEFLADWNFGTQTLGQYGTQISKDTIMDIIMNAFGVFAGAVAIIKKIR